MSSATGLAYGIGQVRRAVGRAGAQLADRPLGVLRARAATPVHGQAPTPTSTAAHRERCSATVLNELPLSCENSFYAATEVGPGGAIWTGTFYGPTIYRPRR